MTCPHCEEPIVGDEPKMTISRAYFHVECFVRLTAGSLGHQMGLCSCPGNPGTMDDPPPLTKRDQARAAYAYWKARTTQARVRAMKAGMN